MNSRQQRHYDEVMYDLHMAQVRHTADVAARVAKIAKAEGRAEEKAKAAAKKAKRAKIAAKRANTRRSTVAARARRHK